MSEQDELATGGVIENPPLIGRESGHEAVYLVRDEPIKTRYFDIALGEGMQSGTYNVTFHANGATTVNPTLCNPGGPALHMGQVNWSPAYQQPQFVPTATFPTEESLREFVKKCVHEALDELAAEMNSKAFKPTRVQ